MIVSVFPNWPLNTGHRTLLISFSAFRAIKDHPDGEVFGEILEAMGFACGRKEKVAGTELYALAFDYVFTSAPHHDVCFVSRVRRLRVRAARRVDFDQEAAVLEHGRESLASRPWQATQPLRDPNYSCLLSFSLFIRIHVSLLKGIPEHQASPFRYICLCGSGNLSIAYRSIVLGIIR